METQLQVGTGPTDPDPPQWPHNKARGWGWGYILCRYIGSSHQPGVQLWGSAGECGSLLGQGLAPPSDSET